MKILTFIVCISCLVEGWSFEPGAAERVGHIRFEGGGETGHIWYPTQSREPTTNQRYTRAPVTKGIEAIDNAPPSPGHHPLIVLSHGILGLSTSYAWLSSLLAQSGAVVLAPDHPKQSRSDWEEPEQYRFYKRPLTLSGATNWILKEKRFASVIDTGRIYLIGHSVGGHSALLLAGARFNLEGMMDGSRKSLVRNKLADRMTQEFVKLKPSLSDIDANARNYRDIRFKKIILLDPTPVYPGFTDQSLGGLILPILYVSCSKSEIFDSDKVKENLLRLIPAMETRETGAGHFIFAGNGTWLGRLVLPSIFKDPPGIDREKVHRDVFTWITGFLDITPLGR